MQILINIDYEVIITCESETLFLPVLAIVDSGPNNFLHEVLWIRAFDGLGIFHCAIRHSLKSVSNFLKYLQN